MSEELPSLRYPLQPRMALCPACGRHVRPSESTCPHCQADVATLWREAEEAMNELREAAETLRCILAKANQGESGLEAPTPSTTSLK